MKRNIALIMLCLFLLSLVIHFVPVWQKGYSFNPFGGEMILARNLSLTGEYKIESKKNVVLSSTKVESEGIPCDWGNKLTPLIYGQIFKNFGFNQKLPLYIALIVWALTGSIFFLIVLKLFNLKVAIAFGLIDIFIPVFVQGSLMAGFYEWALLFFALGLLFYLYKQKTSYLNLVLASLFFGLAALARNAFLLSFIPFVIYDFWKNRSWPRAIIFLLPFVLLWGVYLVPDYLAGTPNAYLSSEDTSFSYYGHLFPDPYTYHFEKEAYIQSILGAPNTLQSEYLLKYNYSISFKDQILMYWNSIRFYIKEFSKLIISGGPFIILFLIAGLVYLYRKRRSLFRLFAIWGIVWYFLLVVLKTNNWDHFLELRLPIALLVSLGVIWLVDFVLSLPIKIKFKYAIVSILAVSLLLHFAQANKWMLHEEYNTTQADIIIELSNIINQKKLDKQNDIIAVNINPAVTASLNYYTDLSFIYFDSQTVEKLIDQHKISWAFEQFGVTKFIGFDIATSQEIIDQTGLENITNPKN